jgi:hypothetical protein
VPVSFSLTVIRGFPSVPELLQLQKFLCRTFREEQQGVLTWRDAILWPAQRVWSALVEHFVRPVGHDAALEPEVVELAVEECAVLGRETRWRLAGFGADHRQDRVLFGGGFQVAEPVGQ